MIEIAFIALIFTLISIWLTMKNNRLCWPTGLVAVVCYLIFYIRSELYLNAALQGVFIGQSIWGWWNWGHSAKNIRKSDISYISIVISIITLMALFLYNLTLMFPEHSDISNPGFDSITTAMSLAGIYLTANRRIEAWFVWMATNLMYILMFYTRGDMIPMVNYLINFPLSIWGYLEWKKIRKSQIDETL
jgi:nicotinamide mononucleotide transporter